jgi:acyl transferase domain-containing protein
MGWSDFFAHLSSFQATASFSSITVGRLSYVLGLQGPSIAVDTACSAALVALDIACEKHRLSHCETALAGGIGIFVLPSLYLPFSNANMLSKEGCCKILSMSINELARKREYDSCAVVNMLL